MRTRPFVHCALHPENSSVTFRCAVERALRPLRRLALPSLLAACANEPRPSPETAVERQPIPAGIDPRMVEWRSDGVLIASADSLRKIPGYVVDSIFPPAEALARFRTATSGPPVTRFTGGAASVDGLLRAYWSALVSRDDNAMSAMALTRPEFAWAYFDGSAEQQAGLQPHVAWRMLESASEVGRQRAMARAAGATGALQGTFCVGAPRRTGGIESRGPCGVVLAPGLRGDSIPIASRVLVRDGVAKLFSFANPL